MNSTYCRYLASELNLKASQVESVLALFGQGATIPFIARYRKEMTGSLDEVVIAAIRDRAEQLRELDKRRSAVISSITDQGLLDDGLLARIQAAASLTELEDLYLPYKPKKKTRGMVAREKGLEPLAKMIMAQHIDHVAQAATRFLNDTLVDVEEALQGARDIMAEWISEHQKIRSMIRRQFERDGIMISKVAKGKEQEGEKYRNYFDWQEKLAKAPSHRVLAMFRGEEEKMLKLKIEPPQEAAVDSLVRFFVQGKTEAALQVTMAAKDAYKRLLAPTLETEMRQMTKEKADETAIRVFAENLKQLLMAPPLGQKNVLAIDPGFRSGCKVVCLDKQGKLVHNENIYPHPPQNDRKAANKILSLVSAYQIEAIAIGNGTAGRETEAFIKKIRFNSDIMAITVNECGASIYSASPVAREEFPDYDVTVRGAVSIGRRLLDPLAELVKIDAKSIGVGQYQHDVNQKMLQKSLDDVVMSCVNAVGVDLNVASKQLLSYVSGVGPALAKNIVDYRNEHGAFSARKDLLKVPRFGTKVFEQAAGFIRIRGGANPLDDSAVHPESYATVERMARDQGCSVTDLMNDSKKRAAIRLENYCTENIGLPTLGDIMAELEKPGRDPRSGIALFTFDQTIHKMEDVEIGKRYPGIVTNITAFGAFVDIGVHQDGLVHISQLADRFVSDPNEAVHLNQQVIVKVLEVDVARKRIQLTMKE